MFERYTERARRILFFARYEAAQLRSNSIDSIHLLLGLLRERAGFAGRALAHVSSDEIRQEIRERRGDQAGPVASVEIPFTDDAKRALQYAAEEAERLVPGASQDRSFWLGFVGVEHLLLGLLREPASAALLEPRGLRLDDVRASLLRSQEPVVFALEENPAPALLAFVPYDPAVHREFADMLRNTPLARHAGHCAALTNASTRRMVSVVARWTAVDPAGVVTRPQYVRRDSYFTDPGSKSIEPGVTVLVTPMGFSEAITGPYAMVWAPSSSHLEDDAASITVALDSVVFEDGQIVGADESGIEGYIQEKRAAVMTLLQRITEAEAAGEDVAAVVASIADWRREGRAWLQMFAGTAMRLPSAWAERNRTLPELPRFWR